MDPAVFAAILSFAGILIGVLAGALGNRALTRRNNKNHGNNPGRMWDVLLAEHVTLEKEIKTNRRLLRGEFKALGKTIDKNRRDIVNAINSIGGGS